MRQNCVAAVFDRHECKTVSSSKTEWVQGACPRFITEQVGRTTFGWLLASVRCRRWPICGLWEVTVEWEKVGDIQTLTVPLEELSIDELEYYHTGSTGKVKVYARTKLIPTIRILWLWLRLWMEKRGHDGNAD